MSKILVCQHVPYEILGTLDPMLRDAGLRIRYANFGREPDLVPSLSGYRGLILLGGPMNVDQEDRHPHLTQEIRLIEEALQKDLPVLGICLGAQLIAKALGAEVCKNSVKEIGWYDIAFDVAAQQDAMFKDFGATERIFQWHGDTFAIPTGAVRLAGSATCTNQAFRYGDKVYGLQFHLEMDAPMIERLLNVPHNRAELSELGDPERPERIRADNKICLARQFELSQMAFGAFIQNLGKKRKYRRLTSR